MKRDMDLIREIMLDYEEFDAKRNTEVAMNPGEEGAPPPEVYDYHVTLLGDAGYLEIKQTKGRAAILRMTWEGHEFLDSIRDPEIWEQAKGGAMAAGGFTLDLLGDLAKGYAKKKIEEKTGIQI